MRYLHPILSNSHRHELNEKVTVEEIYKALFDMSPNKSPRPDDFHALFFQKYWSVGFLGLNLNYSYFEDNSHLL